LVLQVFVTFSVVLPGFGLNFHQVAAVELITALGVIWFLKSWLELLVGFKWGYLLSPKYYWQVAIGKFDASNEIIVGIVFLAFGYALLRFPVRGDIPLLFGVAVLALSGGREFSNRRSFFAAVLTVLNLCFIAYGLVFLWLARAL